MNIIECCPLRSGIYKEKWESLTATEATLTTPNRFRILQTGKTDEGFTALLKELREEYSLPSKLLRIPEDENQHTSGPIYVYRYPLFKKSFKPWYIPVRNYKVLRQQVKRLCIKTNGPIILNSGNKALGYEVSSRRVGIDGEFVIYLRGNHILMAHDPERVKKLLKNPLRLEDPVHRQGRFRISELYQLEGLFENEIRHAPALWNTVRWITFNPTYSPKEHNLAIQILRLVKTVLEIRRKPTYRYTGPFEEFLKKARSVMRCLKLQKIKRRDPYVQRLYAFLRREIKLSNRHRKMV